MNILISGAAGYIGSYFVNNFLNEGHNLGVIVRNNTFNNFDECEIINADISNKINVKPSQQYDVFIHLAAANDIDSKNPDKALAYTTLGTKNVLEYCVENRINKFIYFSTFQVYGKDSGIVNEETSLEIKNHYAITHFFAEKYVEFFNKNNGIEYIIVRPTNIFGGMLSKNINRWSLVPGCFCKEAFETQKITLFSSGRQMRDFISLEKTYNAVSEMIKYFDKAKKNIYNLCSGESVSILETANLVKECYKEIFDKECTLEICSSSPEGSSELSVSTEKLKKMNINTESKNSMKDEVIKIFNLLSL